MQFHHNGFHDGDPTVHKPAEGRCSDQTDFPEKLDVLIIGSGPAGLTLGAQLAMYPQFQTRVIERKPAPMNRGQADGISCRSMEMFKAFGFADKVMKEGYWVNETTFWGPSADKPDDITRLGRVQDVADDLSEMPHIVLNQARVHDMYIDCMRNSPSRLEVDYGIQLVEMTVDPKGGDYPVTVKLERLGFVHDRRYMTVKAKYVVGCDGARSLVRSSIGRELKGDFEGQAWGVMDVLANTTFPDFRFKSIIKSAKEGNILLIPREGGYVARIYVELDKIKERGESKDITLDRLIEVTRNIFKPYSIDVKDVAWWSVYEVGHSVADKFDEVPDDKLETQLPHVFIAGDACHTHSAKAGQGMNVSMGDTFNLGWKMISVLTGKCAPDLLHSYSAERHAVAHGLINYDHKWARIMSAPTTEEEISGAEIPRAQKQFVEGGNFTAGLSVKYEPSALTGTDAWQELATGFEIGTRFHSAPAVRLADAKVVQLNDSIKIDTRWHLYAFAGQVDPDGISKLCDFLADDANSPIVKYTPDGDDLDSVIDLKAVFQDNRRGLDFDSLHPLLRPLVGKFKIHDYEKAFCPDFKGGKDVFDMRGVDRDKGCLVIVRPDQYVAHVLPLDAYDDLAAFFDGFLQKP